MTHHNVSLSVKVKLEYHMLGEIPASQLSVYIVTILLLYRLDDSTELVPVLNWC